MEDFFLGYRFRVDVYYSLVNLARPIIAFHLFSQFSDFLQSQGNSGRLEIRKLDAYISTISEYSRNYKYALN